MKQVPLNLFQGNPLLHMTATTILDTLANPTSAAAINMAKEHLAKLHLDESLGGKAKSALYLLYDGIQVRDPKSKRLGTVFAIRHGFPGECGWKTADHQTRDRALEVRPASGLPDRTPTLDLDKDSVKTYAWPAGAPVAGADGQPNFPSALSTDKQSVKILQTPPDEMVQQDYQRPGLRGEARRCTSHAEGLSDLALLQLTGTGFQPLSFRFPTRRPALPPNSKLVLVQLSLRHKPTSNRPAPSQRSGDPARKHLEDGA